MMRLFLSAWVLLVGVAPLPADGPERPPTRKLTLTPKAASTSLQSRLLPELLEQRTGNAADHYNRATQILKDKVGSLPVEAHAWLDLPADRLPKDELRALLKKAEAALAEVEAGSRCESCDWGMTARLRKDAIGALLPELQTAREFGTLLQLRLRLELAEGRTDRALATTRTNLALARHVGESPTLIGMLVAAALAGLSLDGLERLEQAPDAPNLYWALTDLPQPFIDMRKPLQGERLCCYSLFPGLAEVALDPQAGPLSREQLRTMTEKYIGFGISDNHFPNRWALGFYILRKHEAAKRALIAAGRPRAKVEAMPPLQVALLHAMGEYDRHLDGIIKWQSFSYPQAFEGMQKEDRALRNLRAEAIDPRSDAAALPIAPLLLPAVSKVFKARVRVDRRIAGLRAVEAVRAYAAGHDGKLPATLADVKEVPVPLDPATGKPFRYAVKDGVATLSAADLPEDPPGSNKVHFELTMQK
jgi:hypothetical protein